jgi:hypothetical protein
MAYIGHMKDTQSLAEGDTSKTQNQDTDWCDDPANAWTVTPFFRPFPPRPRAVQLRAVCAWCSTELRPGAEPTSHSICGPCAEKWGRK